MGGSRGQPRRTTDGMTWCATCAQWGDAHSDHVTRVQELRRSNAATAIPSKKRARMSTRQRRRQAAIDDSQ